MTGGEFDSKIVLVTGSTGGLGAQIARDFARAGATVVVTGRKLELIDKTVTECNLLSPDNNDGQSFGVPVDITVESEVKNLIGTVIEQCGKLDVLVNCAGGGVFDGIHDESVVDKIDKMMDLNLKSAVMLTQISMPYLEASRGCIVNIVSQYASRPVTGAIAYSLSKASLLMFTRCAALELGPRGIRVNSVSPSSVRTGFTRSALSLSGTSTSAVDVDNFVAELEGRIPLKGTAKPEDVSGAVLFLASRKANFITGQDLAVDGGQSLL